VTAIVLLSLTGVTVMAGTLVAPILPLVNTEFNDINRVSMLLTLPALGVVFTGPFVGKLVCLFGKKPLLLMALALYVASGTTGLWLDSLDLLLVGRFVLGISMSIIMTLTSTFMADLSAGHGRDKLLSHQAIAMHIGAVGFVSIGGYLAQIGWRIPFAIYFLPVAILTLAVFVLPNLKAEERHEAPNVSKINWKPAAPFYALVFISMSMFYVIPVFYTFLAVDLVHASASQIGNCIAIFSVAAAIGSMQMPRLSKALSTSNVLALACLFYAAGHAGLAFASDWPLLLLGGSLTGLGFGLAFPTLSRAIAVRSTPVNRAIMMSAFVSTYYLGQFATPIIGKAMMTTDIQSMFYISSSIMLAMSTGLLFYKTKSALPASV